MTAAGADGLTVQTEVGPADVLHRLALAVDCRDSVTGHRVAAAVRIGREVPARVLPPGHDPSWPCRDLDRQGVGRALLDLDRRAPTGVTLRIVDPARRLAPRRFALPLWTLPEVLAAEQADTPIRATSRVLRPWLLPGSAAALSRGMTTIRGRVLLGGAPVRWPRVTARGPGDQNVGWAHGDERGEFLLVVEDTGTLPPPAPSTLAVRLFVTAPLGNRPDPLDGYADLSIEPLTRSASPPALTDLDNDVLRGRRKPDDHVASTAVPPVIPIPVGQELALTSPVQFTT